MKKPIAVDRCFNPERSRLAVSRNRSGCVRCNVSERRFKHTGRLEVYCTSEKKESGGMDNGRLVGAV